MPPPFAESQDLARRGQPTFSSQKAKLETRGPWVLTGLSMTLFLIIVGSTGSVLAFYHEPDHWLEASDGARA